MAGEFVRGDLIRAAFSIEIIGQAANKTRVVDPDFAARHTHVPGDLMYGMRNHIVHNYFDVDLQIVW
jgi:uncharacterized protein with HEPN domain